MTWEIAFVLLLIVGTLLCFLSERLPPDVTALLLFVILLVSGIVPQARVLGVLANPAPLTVGAMFILSAALVKSGAIDRLAASLQGLAGFSYYTVIALIVLGVGGLSAFINNTPVVVVLVPVIISLARRMKLPASKFLIPLSYAAVLGGCCTLLGTSTNLLVTGILQSRGLPPLSMFELSWVGVPLLAVGTLYIVLTGRHLLPKREPASVVATEEDRREYITEVFVQPHSPVIGRTLAEAGLVLNRGIRVLELVRDENALPLRDPDPRLAAGDRLMLRHRAQARPGPDHGPRGRPGRGRHRPKFRPDRPDRERGGLPAALPHRRAGRAPPRQGTARRSRPAPVAERRHPPAHGH
jgi:di/tricarboxylate transporter